MKKEKREKKGLDQFFSSFFIPCFLLFYFSHIAQNNSTEMDNNILSSHREKIELAAHDASLMTNTTHNNSNDNDNNMAAKTETVVADITAQHITTAPTINQNDYDNDDAKTKSVPFRKWWEFWKTEPLDVDPHTFSKTKKSLILAIIASAGTM